MVGEKILAVVRSAAFGLVSILALHWAFVPKWYQITALIVTILMVSLGILLIATNSNKEAIQRRLEIKKSVEHYQNVEEFSLEPGPAGVLSEFPSIDSSVWLSKDLTLDQELGLQVVEKLQVFSGGRVVRYSVVVPFEDGRWVEKSTTEFEPHTPISQVLREDHVRQRLKEPNHLVCVGLSSRSDPNASDAIVEQNEARAVKRARNLCLAVAGAVGRDAGSTKGYWYMGLGYSVGAAQDQLTASRQRVAVVIGVSGADKDGVRSGISDLIDNVAISTKVNLRGYSRSGDVRIAPVRIDWETTGQLQEDAQLLEVTE